MDKLENQVNRGARAESLLADPLFSEAREHIEAELYRLFKSAVPTDIEALAQIKSMQYMHDKYIAFLKTVVQDGKIAKLEVERKARHSASEFGYREYRPKS